MFTQITTCPKCRGQGTTIEDPCPSCRGKGTIQRTRKIDLKIPRGIDDGAHLRLQGQGEHHKGARQSGDLYVVVHTKNHPVYERQGADIYRKQTITYPQATLGATVTVQTLGGTERLKIPEGTQTGTLFKIKGAGMPKIHGSGAGDLYVQLQVSTPTKISKRARLLLEELQRELETNDETYK